MRLTYFVVSRSWASSRLRTLLSIAGVALGVAIVCAIHVVDHDTIESQYRKLRSEGERNDVEVVARAPASEPAAIESRLRAIAGVRGVGRWRQATAIAIAGQRQEAVVFGLAPLPQVAFAHYRVEAGDDLTAGDGGGVLLGGELARALALAPGDHLTLERPPLTRRALCQGGKLVVQDDAGTFDPAPVEMVVRGVLAYTGLGRRNLGQVIVGAHDLAAHLAPSQPTIYQIAREEGTDVDRLRRDLQDEFLVLEAGGELLGQASDERAFRNGVKVLGCLALVLGMFVVFQTLSMSLVERLRQLGLLRCLGAGRRSVAGVFLLDALLLGCLGAALGVLGGIGLAWVLQSMGVSTLGRGKEVTVFEVPWLPVLWTAVLGVLFTLAGAAFPLWKARNLPTLEILSAHGLEDTRRGGGAYVLRGVNVFLFVLLVLVLPGAYLAMTPLVSEEGRETLIVLAQLGGMIVLFGTVLLLSPALVRVLGRALLWPLRGGLRLPAFLVGKELQQRPGRFAASVCGLAVVLLALIALNSITHALRGEARQFAAQATQDRLFLKSAPLTPARARTLGAVPGVEAIVPFAGRTQTPRFALRGVDLADLGAVELDDAQRRRYSERRSLIISTRLANLVDRGPGEVIVMSPDGGATAYEVLAVSDGTGFFPDERTWAIAAPRWLQQDYCVGEACVDTLSLRLTAGANADVVLARLREREPSLHWAKTGAELLAYHLRDIDGDFRIFDVLLGLIVVLAGVGLLNAMTIAALGRAREIGVLRALGMNAAALRATFLIEGLLVAVLATLLAIALGLPLGQLVVAGLNRVSGLAAPFVTPWPAVAWAPALAGALGVAAAVLPGLRAVRESPAEAVRYE